MTAKGAELSIGFRFAERIVTEDVASERGVYRIVMALPGEPERVVYGRFHTFARKADGRWRIAVDYDTDDVAEADYTAAVEG
jgi:ketosteroid isomerase-like protein